jgi:hypothetical protein
MRIFRAGPKRRVRSSSSPAGERRRADMTAMTTTRIWTGRRQLREATAILPRPGRFSATSAGGRQRGAGEPPLGQVVQRRRGRSADGRWLLGAVARSHGAAAASSRRRNRRRWRASSGLAEQQETLRLGSYGWRYGDSGGADLLLGGRGGSRLVTFSRCSGSAGTARVGDRSAARSQVECRCWCCSAAMSWPCSRGAALLHERGRHS